MFDCFLELKEDNSLKGLKIADFQEFLKKKVINKKKVFFH